MGWWEREISFESMIDSALWYFKIKLKPWVTNLIDIAVMKVSQVSGIGSSLWDDLERWLDERIEDFLPNIVLSITSARQLAQYLHDTLKIDLEKKIDALSDLPAQTIAAVTKALEPMILSARQYAEYLTDTLKIETARQIKGANDYAKRLQTGTLAELDRRIGMVTIAMGKMDTVAGEARAALIRDLGAIIKIAEREALAARESMEQDLGVLVKMAEREALAARNAIKRSLDSAIISLDNSSRVARKILENKLKATLDVLEREAKEAREVLEGTLIQIIENVEDALEIAITDLERRFKGLLDAVINRVDVLERWVDSAAGWFDKELNKYQNRVVGWIVDGFEGILDRVFK